jgi:polyphosphate kinase
MTDLSSSSPLLPRSEASRASAGAALTEIGSGARRRTSELADPAGSSARRVLERSELAARYLNRELSWLDFADRLLDLSEDRRLPVLERLKFLAIHATGMDEFFQVRVAGLKDQAAAGLRVMSIDGSSPTQQLAAIRSKVGEQVTRAAAIFSEGILPSLAAAGIEICDASDLDPSAHKELLEVFGREIFPVLTPLAVDPGHPFPYISNLSLNLAVMVVDPVSEEQRFARVKVPPLLPRFVALSDGERFVPLEQVIAANLASLFPQMELVGEHAFRVTRNADFTLEEEEADDLLEAVEIELRRRRFGRAVRLEVAAGTSSEIEELLARELELEPVDVFRSAAPLDLGQLWSFCRLDRPELAAAPYAPATQARLAPTEDDQLDLFAVIRERDVLVHHPYDSFATSVAAFISAAADDPAVLAIKQTLYRTSGDAPFVAALARAAEAGKQVAALVELKARFDEQANISWARQLERSGVHVVYGLLGLKTHSKTALVVRREEDGIRRYCHVGTGNYNSDTARSYEDLGLLSADPDLGEDLSELFNFLTGYSRQDSYRKLILAPRQLRTWVLGEIAAEAARGPLGRITIKVNGLTDREVIDALYAASAAGCEVDCIVRGVCCLRPLVPGLSDRIRVRSIVGRFLEHSRCYRFGADPPRYFIGSADMMERNLERRIEAVVPVEDGELCGRLDEILELCLADNVGAWMLGADGAWSRPTGGEPAISVQAELMARATSRSSRRPPTDPLSGSARS